MWAHCLAAECAQTERQHPQLRPTGGTLLPEKGGYTDGPATSTCVSPLVSAA